jgi:V/A-type H+/Na+-transporting ATPase subunit C
MSAAGIMRSGRTPETDEAYAATRMRGMRSRLLAREFYDRLIEAPDATRVAKELLETQYGPDLHVFAAREGFVPAAVEGALKAHIIRTVRKVMSLLAPTARAQLSALMGRWDIFNLKTVLRGAHRHVLVEETVSGFYPAGSLGERELEALAALDDVGAVIDTLATWGVPYATPLRLAYPAYSGSADLVPLEQALDRHYARWASRQLSGEDAGIARRVFRVQMDTANLVTVFRAIKAEAEFSAVEQYFLEGGQVVTRDIVRELVELTDIDHVLDRLRGTAYSEALDGAAVRYLARSSIPVFERALEELLMKTALSASLKDPLGVGLAISLLYATHNEVTNVRIIAKGKAVGMPAERIEEELLLV